MATALDKDYPVDIPDKDLSQDCDGAVILEATFKDMYDVASSIYGYYGIFAAGTIGCSHCNGPIVRMRSDHPIVDVHPVIGGTGAALCGDCTHLNHLFLNFSDTIKGL